jgi:ketosteroid isomerase-like protein
MKPTYRNALAMVAALVVTGLAACGDRTAEDDATLDAPPATIGAPAAGATAPSELQDEVDSFEAAWNQDDPLLAAEYFTDDAVVQVDDNTMTGRQQIMQQWLEPNVPAVSNVQIHHDRWDAAGEEYRGSGRFTMDTAAQGQTQQASGTFEATWVRRGEFWRMRALTIRNDSTPQ